MHQRRKLLLAILVTTVILTLASMGTALAAPIAQEGGKQGLFGVVTGVTKDTVTVKKDGETVSLKLDASSTVSVPGIVTPTATDITVGSRVAILAERRADGLYLLKLTVVPAEPQDKHVTLTVLEVSGRTVIAETSSGEQIVVELQFDLPGDLKGQLITFIGQQPESNRFRAKAAMKLENVIARLDKHVKEKKGEADRERDPQSKGKKQREVEDLKARLEDNLKSHLDRFAEVIAKAPEQARPALEQALENFKKATEAALRGVDRSPQDVQKVVERRTVKGVVESIDATSSSVVVRSTGAALVTVKVATGTKVIVGEVAGSFADIRTGDPVEVRFDSRTGEAESIRVKLEVEAEGSIKAIDATAKTVTLALAGNATLALKVVEGTKIEINDRPAALANLTDGMVVEVKYNSRTLELKSVEGELEAEFELTVKSVDPQARIIVGQTDDGISSTIKVTDRTKVEAKGHLSSIFGIQPGARITVEINPLTGEAIKIKLVDVEKRREEVNIRGIISKVDTAAKKFTVRLPNKSEITVAVADATTLEVDGKDAKLADLKEGDQVKLEYEAQTMVALEVEVKKTVEAGKRPRPEPRRGESAKEEGTITARDPSKGTLTIFTKNGETRVITIRAETAMTFNGKRISALSELPLGAAVKVEFTEGNVAIKIEAKKGEAEDKEEKSQGDREQRRTLEAKATPKADRTPEAKRTPEAR